MKIIKT